LEPFWAHFVIILDLFLNNFFEVLGGSGQGFWDVFFFIFGNYIEKRDLVKISVSPRREQENQGFDS